MNQHPTQYGHLTPGSYGTRNYNFETNQDARTNRNYNIKQNNGNYQATRTTTNRGTTVNRRPYQRNSRRIPTRNNREHQNNFGIIQGVEDVRRQEEDDQQPPQGI